MLGMVTHRERVKGKGKRGKSEKPLPLPPYPFPHKSLNWDTRYGDLKKYKKKVAIAHRKHRQAHSKCCCCLNAKATQMHHTEYTNQEKLGVNWFPLCEKCHHEVAHASSNWIRSKTNPVKKNRNTPEFVKRLQLGFNLLYGGINW